MDNQQKIWSPYTETFYYSTTDHTTINGKTVSNEYKDTINKDNTLELILKKLNIMEEDIHDLNLNIKEIKSEMKQLKMNNHVDFVESVYDKIKFPFHFILNSVEHIRTIKMSQTQAHIENISNRVSVPVPVKL